MKHPSMIEAKGVGQTLSSGGGSASKVLQDVSLALHGGELTLLHGPSGSGKTTLLSILGCLRTPTEGSVAVMGESTLGYGPDALARVRRSRIGFVFQSYNLFPTLTARENLRLSLDACEWRRGDPSRRVAEVLEAVGLGKREHARPPTMSGGEQQRLAIARAIAGEAPIILADEPTAALDGQNGRRIMELLADLAHRSAACVMVVTHDPRTEDYADRVVRIEDGGIVDDVRLTSSAESPVRSGAMS